MKHAEISGEKTWTSQFFFNMAIWRTVESGVSALDERRDAAGKVAAVQTP
jgi:hypothetical protein